MLEKKYSVYLDKKESKWEMIYLLNVEKLITLKKIINNLYNEPEFQMFKKYCKKDIYNDEISSLSKIMEIESEKIYFYNNIIPYMFFSSTYILESHNKIIHTTQYESFRNLKEFIINIDFYKKKEDMYPLFTGVTILGYIGILAAKNNELSISLNFDKFHNDNFIYENENPGISIREIFVNNLNYKQSKNILSKILLKNSYSFVLSNKNKYKIISRDLSNIYHVGTDTSFLIKTHDMTKEISQKKKILEILKYPICNYSKMEILLFGSSIDFFINNRLLSNLLKQPFLSDNTIFFYTCSVSYNFYDIHLPTI